MPSFKHTTGLVTSSSDIDLNNILYKPFLNVSFVTSADSENSIVGGGGGKGLKTRGLSVPLHLIFKVICIHL